MQDLADLTRKEFEKAMDKDFATNNALTVWFNCLKELNRQMDLGLLNSAEKVLFTELMERLDSVFGVLKPRVAAQADSRIDGLIAERNKARTDKNWARADEIRQQLKAEGIELEDSPKGTIWKKI
jgi:cysteinyl-tRNA synthetase